MQDYDFDLQSIQAVRDLARKGKIAANQLAHYDEEQIDRILRNMVKVAEENAQVLASMAVEETGFGKVCGTGWFSARTYPRPRSLLPAVRPRAEFLPTRWRWRPRFPTSAATCCCRKNCISRCGSAWYC